MDDLHIKQDPANTKGKAVNDSFRWLLIWGCVYGGPVWYVVFNLSYLFVGALLLTYTAYLSRDNFQEFSEASHFTLVTLEILIITIFYNKHGKSFDNMFRLIGTGFYDYGFTFDSNTFDNLVDKKRQLIKSIKRRRSKYFLKTVFITMLVTGIGQPISDWYTGHLYDNITETLNSETGIVKFLPVKLWFPFESDSMLHLIGAIVYEYYAMAAILGSALCTVLPIILFSEELCNEFEILGESLILFKERAKALYKIRHGINPDIKNRKKDFQFEKCIKDCLRDSVRHHQMLINYFNSLHNAVSGGIMTSILLISLLMCLSGFLFMDESVQISIKVKFFFYGITEFSFAFIFCWYSEKIQTFSNLPMEAIYSCEWYQYSDTIKSYSLIIQPGSQTLKLTAGGLIVVTLDTFADICRSSYSYLSLIQASKE